MNKKEMDHGAKVTWQAVRESWAWLDQNEFIDLEEITDAVAARCGAPFEGQTEIMIFMFRRGIESWIKARAWLGPHISADGVRQVMDSEEFLSKYSCEIQERYLVDRDGRQGYVRLAGLTEAERESIGDEIREEGELALAKAMELEKKAEQRTNRAAAR